jgi:hypothetical protein
MISYFVIVYKIKYYYGQKGTKNHLECNFYIIKKRLGRRAARKKASIQAKEY